MFSDDFSIANTFMGFMECFLDLSLNKHRGQNAELWESNFAAGQDNIFGTRNVLMIGFEL